MRHVTYPLATVALLLTACGAAAQNIGFMRKGPVAYLSEAERDLLRDAVRSALDVAGDGETVDWRNPDTGHGGTIEVLDTHEDYGTTCRTIRSRMQVAGREGGGDYRLCKAEDGTWRFAPARQSPR